MLIPDYTPYTFSHIGEYHYKRQMPSPTHVELCCQLPRRHSLYPVQSFLRSLAGERTMLWNARIVLPSSRKVRASPPCVQSESNPYLHHLASKGPGFTRLTLGSERRGRVNAAGALTVTWECDSSSGD